MRSHTLLRGGIQGLEEITRAHQLTTQLNGQLQFAMASSSVEQCHLPSIPTNVPYCRYQRTFLTVDTNERSLLPIPTNVPYRRYQRTFLTADTNERSCTYNCLGAHLSQ
jgi:hypothetical protein